MKRFSRDRSSLECAGRTRTFITIHAPTAMWKNRTSVRTVAPNYTTAHHAPIIWLSTQSQMDRCGFAPHIKALFVRIICALYPFSVYLFRHYPYTVPFYTPLQILCGTRRNQTHAFLMSLYTAFGCAVVNQYLAFTYL